MSLYDTVKDFFMAQELTSKIYTMELFERFVAKRLPPFRTLLTFIASH